MDDGWFYALGRFFYLEPQTKSYDDANEHCGTMGGHLAVFNTEEEFRALQGIGSRRTWPVPRE